MEKQFKAGEDVLISNSELRGIVLFQDNSGEVPKVAIRFHDIEVMGSAIDDIRSLNHPPEPKKTTYWVNVFKVFDEASLPIFKCSTHATKEDAIRLRGNTFQKTVKIKL